MTVTRQEPGQDARPTSKAVQRLVTAAERVLAVARQQAELAAKPAHQPQFRRLERELENVESYIRSMNAAGGFLSMEEGQSLAQAKDYRRSVRQQLQEMEQPYQERAKQWRDAAWKLEQALKKWPRQADERGQLKLLLEALDPLRSVLNGTELRAWHDAAHHLKALESQASRAAAAPEEAKGQPAPEAPDPSAAYLPSAAALEFDAHDAAIITRLEQRQFDAVEDYRLNLTAQHLSLVSGFEVLLCVPLLRGVEQYPFQINTARQVLRTMRGRALLCDEVGLGKTIEAGLILKEYLLRGLARKVLVLAPPALVSQWREEMRDKFGVSFVTHEDAEFRALGEAAWERTDRVIASLHTAKSAAHSARIHKLSYDLVIVDEAHHLKNRATVNWKFVNDLKSKYILLLTATPAQNNLDELFNLITLLSPGQLQTAAAFRREFVERGDPRKPKNRTKLRELLMDVMVRNTRSQVSVALPPRHAYTLRMDLSPAERALYEAATSYVRTEYQGRSNARFVAQTLQSEVGSSAPALRATLEGMSRREKKRSPALDELCDLASGVTTSAKTEALLNMLRQAPVKTLVFTQYRETQHFLLRSLEQAGIGAAAFSGELSAAQKDEQVAAFARDRQVLVSTDVGSEGRNLQFCHTLVNYDLPWNPMKIEQRIGRVHRIGQTEPVHIFNLAAHDTVEDYVLEVLDSKINMFELVVGEVGEILGNLDEEREFEDIVLDLWVNAPSAAAAREAFDQLGEQLVEARRKYLEAKSYDDALFGADFVAEE